MYVLSDFLAWLLHKVFRYRLKVIEKNILLAGLELDEKEHRKFLKNTYKNLSDVLLEGIRSFTMSRSSIKKRHKVLNPEIVSPYFQKQQSLILVTGHLGNWEWGSLSAGLQTDYHIFGFYKTLKNKFIDRFLRRSRSRFGTTLASIRKTSISFESQKKIPTLFLMAADQNPSKLHKAHWVDFMGRKTAFLYGAEKHAKQNNYPVIFAEIIRVKRGFYELDLSILADKPLEYKEGEITALFARKLEKAIRKNPSQWLWTHKRWKHQQQQGEKPVY